ncbi:MAG TPA: hypothetical protein VJ743_15000 [Albitalea sp.]|nr:hypothetical protein [Albitalea sp.]
MEKSTTGGLWMVTVPTFTFRPSDANVVGGVVADSVIGEVPVGTGTGGTLVGVSGGGVTGAGVLSPPPPHPEIVRAAAATMTARPDRINLIFIKPPSP